MIVWVAYGCGVATLPVFGLIVVLCEWFVDSRWNPWGGEVECLVCGKRLGHQWRWWAHRLGRRHLRLYRQWIRARKDLFGDDDGECSFIQGAALQKLDCIDKQIDELERLTQNKALADECRSNLDALTASLRKFRETK